MCIELHITYVTINNEITVIPIHIDMLVNIDPVSAKSCQSVHATKLTNFFFFNPTGVAIYNKEVQCVCLTNMATNTDRGTVNGQGLLQNCQAL